MNGKEAIDKARELHPDLVVLDLSQEGTAFKQRVFYANNGN